MKKFDSKFGATFIAGIPALPGVYRIFDSAGALIYVGKAKNLKRRLSQYRNAKRRKAHLKMRAIVADAAEIQFETCATELDALLLENQLVQTHRPKWNIDGAFSFLYPMIGIRSDLGLASFCYTTSPDQFPEFRFHGAFRSRQITREAFLSLMDLLGYIGHPQKGPRRRLRYSLVFSFRQIPEAWLTHLHDFLLGQSTQAIEDLILALTENAGARSKRKLVQKKLNWIRYFLRHEIRPLSKARKQIGFETYPVPQSERDRLLLKYRQKYRSKPAKTL